MRAYKKHYLDSNSKLFIQCERENGKTHHLLRYQGSWHPFERASAFISKEAFEILKKETFAITRTKIRNKILKAMKHSKSSLKK